MKPSEEAALELFDKAMETEREGIKVYEEAAVKAEDVKAKEIFQMLAEASAVGSEKIPGCTQSGIYIGSFYTKRCPCNVKIIGLAYILDAG